VNGECLVFTSTLLSRHNKAGLKCPSVRTYVHPSTKCFFDFTEIWHVNNNNNNNNQDDIYGAVIMAKPLREFTRFI